jgi:AcrR family transcriptional regulator
MRDPLMLRPVSLNPRDMLADAAYPLLLQGGARALSMRGMARQMNISVGSMCDWAPKREETFRVVAETLGGRWEQLVQGRLYREGFDAFLPSSEEELEGCRVWVTTEELGRSFPAVALEVADAHERERVLLREQGVQDADTLHAILRGLRVAVSDPGRPHDVGAAHAAWLDTVLRRWDAGAGKAS